MKTKNLLLAGTLVCAMAVTSCSSRKDISYFQDLNPGMQTTIVNANPIKLQPADKVSIIVSTSDGRLNSLFNLPMPQGGLGGTTTKSSSMGNSQGVAPYTINSQGDIDFPVLGRLHVAGMTREGLAEYIRRELISRDLAKNPIVTVDYLNLNVTVLGEVGSAGRIAIDREDFTIIDALSEAGDLSIFGRRNNIRVLREENGVQKVYAVDIRDGQSLVQSPVYFLKQNDVIYVEPNDTRARTSTPNGNSALTPAFWFSIVSFATSMALLVVNLTK